MKTRKSIWLFLILIIIPNVGFADTIYLKDDTVIEGDVFGEDVNSFFVKKQGGNYSIIFSHHEIKKKDIFAIIDSNMMLIYPKNLTYIVTDESFIGELTDREYQAYQLKSQIEQQKNLNKTVGNIRDILFAQMVLILAAGIVVAVAQ